MLDFQTYVLRHGESAMQALIECLERYDGINTNGDLTLESRWDRLMSPSLTELGRAA